MLAGGTNRVVFATIKRAFQELKEKGIVSQELLGEVSMEERTEVLGLPDIYEMERCYASTSPNGQGN